MILLNFILNEKLEYFFQALNPLLQTYFLIIKHFWKIFDIFDQKFFGKKYFGPAFLRKIFFQTQRVQSAEKIV